MCLGIGDCHELWGGDKLWVVKVVAPFGGAEAMVAGLKVKVFPAKEIKMLVTSPDGKRTVRAV